jgi:membrane protein implicated in regulation of membrane protease activity
MHKHKTIAILACSGLVLAPLAATAYVGPGAGLSLLGALWALIVAVAAAVVFLFAWPIRRMRRRKREAMELEEQERRQRNGQPAAAAGEPPSTIQPQERREPRTP